MAKPCKDCDNVEVNTNMKTNRYIMLICGAIALPFMAFILQALLATNQAIAVNSQAIADSNIATHKTFSEYKLDHSITTGDLRLSVEKVNGSVNAMSDDMVDVKQSNQNALVAARDTATAVNDLVRALENQGLLAKTHDDSSFLLASDFGQ